MIVSASCRTDIPAFYGRWFMNRLNEGFCRVANPFNRQQVATVSLRREDVDAFVFWTKNLTQFLSSLEEVHQRGFPFAVQYSVNAYPRTLEYSVVEANRSVGHFHLLSEKYGSQVPVWRYDPIVFSSLTPASFHLENFEWLASSIRGACDEVIVSFAQIYRKTRRNMNQTSRQFGFAWEDPEDGVKKELLGSLAKIAAKNGFRLTLCAQPELLVPGVYEAHCIDAIRLSKISGKLIKARTKGTRPGCLCHQSKDIGNYDTCPHGCVYCYAVQHRSLAQRRFRNHDPAGEFLSP